MSAADITAVEKPPEPPRGWTKARITGHVLLALWSLLGLGLLWFLATSWNPELIQKYAPGYFSGIVITLKLVAISCLVGALLSIPIAYMRMSKNTILSAIAKERNRAVLVVTHDPRLFGFADRIVHIEDGLLTREESTRKDEPN